MKTLTAICIVYMCASSAIARQSKPIGCMNDIRRLSASLDAFRDQCSVYPPAERRKEEIVGTTNATLNTLRIRFIESERDLIDPWGNAFVVVAPGKHNTNSVDLYSLGRDGESETGGSDPDDINNWDPEHTWLYEAYGFVTQEQAERRGRIIFAIPFLVLGFAVATEAILIRTWIRKRRNRSQRDRSQRDRTPHR